MLYQIGFITGKLIQIAVASAAAAAASELFKDKD